MSLRLVGDSGALPRSDAGVSIDASILMYISSRYIKIVYHVDQSRSDFPVDQGVIERFSGRFVSGLPRMTRIFDNECLSDGCFVVCRGDWNEVLLSRWTLPKPQSWGGRTLVARFGRSLRSLPPVLTSPATASRLPLCVPPRTAQPRTSHLPSLAARFTRRVPRGLLVPSRALGGAPPLRPSLVRSFVLSESGKRRTRI